MKKLAKKVLYEARSGEAHKHMMKVANGTVQLILLEEK